jgi:uncharacterized delta-60 repeat protein
MRPRGLPIVLLVAAIAGCATVLGLDDTTLRTDAPDGALPGDGGGTDAIVPPGSDGAAAALTALPSPAVVRRGSSVDVTVTIDRGAATGAFAVSVTDLPPSVSAAPATIAADATSTKLTIAADKNAALGASTLHVAIDPPQLPAIALPLLVADPAGALDTTFAGGVGIVAETTRGTAATFYALALQPDGKIVAAGQAQTPAGWLIRRFNADGSADLTFAPTTLPTDGTARALAIDSAGRVVCAGTSSPGAGAAQLTVVRLGATGAPDATFGTAGVYRLTAVDGQLGSTGYALAIQPDAAIVVGGSRKGTINPEDAIAIRLLPTGTRDNSLGGGIVIQPKARWIGAAIETGGAIVLGGSDLSAASGQPSFVLTRRSGAGAVDATFGTGGSIVFGAGDRADAFVRMPDGTLALTGESVLPGNMYVTGVASTTAAIYAHGIAATTNPGFFGAAAQGDGRLVAAGHTSGAGGEARVERIFPDGGPDDTFGDAGAAILQPKGGKPGLETQLFAAAVQADGRILAAGNRASAGAVIFRLWP